MPRVAILLRLLASGQNVIMNEPLKRKCFAPDRLVIGLLVVECLLWLSDSLQWFAKGWGVLIAIACVGVAVVLMLLWLAASLILRRRFQFSIRSLLVLVLAVAIPSGWLAVESERAHRQRETVEWILKKGCDVHYDWEFGTDAKGLPNVQPQGPKLMRNLLGDDFFNGIRGAYLYSDITYLNITITDADLKHLETLIQLQTLVLDGTQITDDGLEHLNGMKQLQSLYLDDTTVTDAGLEHLKGMIELQQLSLARTKVTDVGLENLKGFPQLNELNLGGTQVTDAGLVHLRGLTNLQSLDLWATACTQSGVTALQNALPNCKIKY
jgi:Leucine Rich repeat